jgi:hypothetical protein
VKTTIDGLGVAPISIHDGDTRRTLQIIWRQRKGNRNATKETDMIDPILREQTPQQTAGVYEMERTGMVWVPVAPPTNVDQSGWLDATDWSCRYPAAVSCLVLVTVLVAFLVLLGA